MKCLAGNISRVRIVFVRLFLNSQTVFMHKLEFLNPQHNFLISLSKISQEFLLSSLPFSHSLILFNRTII